jgi:hypothetical protein
MPKYHDLIADNYATDAVSNNILVNDLFNKYSPCNSKFIAMTNTKRYIVYKLNKAIRAVKYESKSLEQAIDEKIVTDVWSALCPLTNTKQFNIKIPDTLHMELEKIVALKTQSFNKNLKTKMKLKLKDNKSNSNSGSEQDLESEDKSDSDEEKLATEKKRKSSKQDTKGSTKKLTKQDKKLSKEVTQKKSESDNSDSNSESDSE